MYQAAAVGAFVGGALSKYLVNCPPINKESLKVLGLHGLYGVAIHAASLTCNVFVVPKLYAEMLKHNDTLKPNNKPTLGDHFVTYVLSGSAVTIAMKLFLNRVGISMSYKEAFLLFGQSGGIALSFHVFYEIFL